MTTAMLLLLPEPEGTKDCGSVFRLVQTQLRCLFFWALLLSVSASATMR
jgi:hypothetical protein